MNIKKIAYIAAFGFFGFLVATIVHSVVEMVTLNLIFGDQANATSFWWLNWPMLHSVVGTALWTAGVFLGLYAGSRWWEEYGSKPGAFGWWK